MIANPFQALPNDAVAGAFHALRLALRDRVAMRALTCGQLCMHHGLTSMDNLGITACPQWTCPSAHLVARKHYDGSLGTLRGVCPDRKGAVFGDGNWTRRLCLQDMPHGVEA